MGNNIDFCELLGLPKKIECPRCRREILSWFNDYDIECGHPEAANNNGKMKLSCHCDICEYDFNAEVSAEVKIEEFK